MERKPAPFDDAKKTAESGSPVKAMIAWLVEADREYRAAQTMINETRNKL